MVAQFGRTRDNILWAALNVFKPWTMSRSFACGQDRNIVGACEKTSLSPKLSYLTTIEGSHFTESVLYKFSQGLYPS